MEQRYLSGDNVAGNETVSRTVSFKLGNGASGLVLIEDLPSLKTYEIHGVRRGLGVTLEGLDIVAEGMGIGGPLGLYKQRALFALNSHDTHVGNEIRRIFSLNGISVKNIGRLRVGAPYKMVHSLLSPLYVRHRSFRPFYQFLMSARTSIGLRSQYSRIEEIGRAYITYEPVEDGLDVEVEYDGLDGGNLLVANELSGRLFTTLLLDGRRIENIPPWIEVTCEEATLFSHALRIGMEVQNARECRLYAGREVLGNRLNWAGFSYVLGPEVRRLNYRVRFSKFG